jgi:hypothetical protein
MAVGPTGSTYTVVSGLNFRCSLGKAREESKITATLVYQYFKAYFGILQTSRLQNHPRLQNHRDQAQAEIKADIKRGVSN